MNRQGSEEHPPYVDMSEEAIDRRLRELGQLHALGVELRSARWLGSFDVIERGPAGDDERTSPAEPERS